MLTSTSMRTPSSRNGSASASRMRPATSIASAGCAMSGSSTANSSPPSRATVSPGRTARSRRRATTSSSWSPAGWPRVSLTSLNRSRSSRNSAIPAALAARVVERRLDPALQQDPVGQVGEGVVQRLPLLGARDRRRSCRRRAAAAAAAGPAARPSEVMAAMNGETASTARVEKVKYQKSSVNDSHHESAVGLRRCRRPARGSRGGRPTQDSTTQATSPAWKLSTHRAWCGGDAGHAPARTTPRRR